MVRLDCPVETGASSDDAIPVRPAVVAITRQGGGLIGSA